MTFYSPKSPGNTKIKSNIKAWPEMKTVSLYLNEGGSTGIKVLCRILTYSFFKYTNVITQIVRIRKQTELPCFVITHEGNMVYSCVLSAPWLATFLLSVPETKMHSGKVKTIGTCTCLPLHHFHLIWVQKAARLLLQHQFINWNMPRMHQVALHVWQSKLDPIKHHWTEILSQWVWFNMSIRNFIGSG